MRYLTMAIALIFFMMTRASIANNSNPKTSPENQKPTYVRLDRRFYPVSGTSNIEFYIGLILFDSAQLRNCHRLSGAAATHSSMIFVSADGSEYVYLLGTQHFRYGPTFFLLDLHSSDGDLICDNPFPSEPGEWIFSNGYEQM
jgi:hypothetical protein